MRARRTLITTIAAVLVSLAPALPAHAAPSGGGGSWFAATSLGPSQVELVARFRASQRDRLAAVAKVLTTPPPAPVEPNVEDPTSFVWPAHAAITSGFGRRWGRRHTGVDIDAAYGSSIVAAQAGTVTLAGWKNGYGNTVIIDHGHGISTLYGHQSRLAVRTGQHVDQGQLIGKVGATGHVTAPHLHYEVLIGGVPRNPVPWLR
jgi:murein DD-endopeptidase MepM/ murein hydrolase activator NlpD